MTFLIHFPTELVTKFPLKELSVFSKRKAVCKMFFIEEIGQESD